MHSQFAAGTLPGLSKACLPVFACVLGLFASTVFSADVTSTWSTATSGNWDLNGNWTNVPALGGFPNNGNGGVATYDAVINALGSPYTVTRQSSCPHLPAG